jgi:hypothetical protein
MKHSHVLSIALACTMAFGIAGHAWGEEESSRPPGGSASLAITKFYTSSMSGVGVFPGTLVRTSCGSISTGVSTCGQTDHALIVDGDQLGYPLVPGSDDVRAALESPAFQHGEVFVHGKYYPSIGAILVNRITAKCEQSKC